MFRKLLLGGILASSLLLAANALPAADVKASACDDGCKKAAISVNYDSDGAAGLPSSCAGGHKPVLANNGYVPTCTNYGRKSDIKCSVCGEILEEGAIEFPLGHKKVSANNGTPATCKSDGRESDMICSVCGITLEEGQKIESPGHKYRVISYSWSSGNKTCTGTIRCTVCGYTHTEESPVTVKTEEPTYLSRGRTIYSAIFMNRPLEKQTKIIYTSAAKTLEAPSKLKCTANGTNAVKLSWDKVKDATGYRVYQYNSTYKTWKDIAEIGSNSTISYVVKGLAAGSTDKFKVSAYVKDGNIVIYSKYSNSATYKNKQALPKVTAKASKGSINVTCAKVSGAKNYKLLYTTNGKTYKSAGESTKRSWKLTKVTPGKEYKLLVLTYDGKSWSKYKKGDYSVAVKAE